MLYKNRAEGAKKFGSLAVSDPGIVFLDRPDPDPETFHHLSMSKSDDQMIIHPCLNLMIIHHASIFYCLYSTCTVHV